MKKLPFYILGTALAFLLSASPAWAAASNPAYMVHTERPAYDANIDSIDLIVINNMDEESAFGMQYTLERLDGENWEEAARLRDYAIPVFKDGNWILELHTHETLDYSDLEIAAILPAGEGTSQTISMEPYQKPLVAGRYRISKKLDGEQYYAEFSILSPNSCIKLPEPESATVTLKNNGAKAVFTVGPEESPKYLNELWHELLAFQKGSKPEGLSSPIATVTLNRKKKLFTSSSDSIDLYANEEQTWAKMDERWYFLDDPHLPDRLEAKGRQLGAYLPATGDELISVLNALEPLKNVQFIEQQLSKPFSLPGWQSEQGSSGIALSIFQFPSAEAVNRQMNYLYDNGYSLGIESSVGSGSSQAVSFSRQRFDWEKPPHYFKAGARLVLYNGSDTKILAALEGLLGPEVEPYREPSKASRSGRE